MKTLFILRHAKSSWDNPNLSDYDRPLNKRGKRDAPRMGEHIHQQSLVPDFILTSSAKRARKTASKVAKGSRFAGNIKQIESFYHAPVGIYLDTLQSVSEKHLSVMVVGHNPTMEQLVRQLTGEMVIMPTTALAHIELPINNWTSIDLYTRGNLLNLWTPKTLFSD